MGSETSRVFISHASADRDLADSFVDLLVAGLGLRSNQVFCSSVAGQGVQQGRQFLEVIKSELSESPLAIFLITDAFLASRFCMCEMGAAWALDKEVFPFIFPPLTHSDLHEVFLDRHVTIVTGDACLDGLRDRLQPLGDPTPLARWTAKKTQFLNWLESKSTRSKAPEILKRGDVLDHILDAALALAPLAELSDIRSEILRHIRSGRVIPTTYCYITDTGFHNWMELCEDREYRYFQDACTFYVKHSPELSRVVFDAVGQKSIDYLSLGPGNGDKDLSLLRGIARVIGVREPEIYYYPFDINAHMISAAVSRVMTDRELRGRLKVKAVISDFSELAVYGPVYSFRSAPNVIALLGNTLGNMDNEREFLDRSFRRAMLPGDILLIEVKRVTDAKPEKTMGNPDLNRKFDFGPLEALRIPFEASKLEYADEKGRSPIPGTLTSVARYKGLEYEDRHYDDVLLSYVHHYDPDELIKVLRQIGFTILYSANEDCFSFIAVQKR